MTRAIRHGRVAFGFAVLLLRLKRSDPLPIVIPSSFRSRVCRHYAIHPLTKLSVRTENF